MKISNLILISISFILLLFAITTYVNYKQSEEVRENTEFLSVSSDIVRQSNQFQRNILYMERALRGYYMTSDLSLLQTYDSASVENQTLLTELSTLIPDTSIQRKILEDIKFIYHDWTKQFAEPLRKTSLVIEKHSALADQFQGILREEEKINKSLQTQFRELLNIEYSNRERRRGILNRSEQRTKIISFLLTALSTVVGFIIAFFLARYISRRISKMVTMANSIANGNYKVQVKDKAEDELSQLAHSLNHMARMLEENISRLKRKNEELDQFAHIVSHDLKAPLRGIDNVISWIDEDHGNELPTKVNEYLRLIKGRIKRSENLIEGILTYARVGKEEKEQIQVDVNQVINDILNNLPIKPGLAVTVLERLPVIISEKYPLIQVFTNLISNAIKHHDKQNGEIRIYYEEQQDHYRFFIEDNGPGIDKVYHNKIFMIFQTLRDRDTFESTGVGLAIVKKILDERGEQLQLTSELKKGSVFSFTWTKLYNNESN